ncbi:phosphopantothenoylcysteine decarboxylase [Cryptococcus neoformans]|nr:phosphopantothenoylcysteine decarboxylase [Cryptococcus neoformans var. grubii]OXC61387.1 phosphopantothenoylcysteine decarboxylase [Cryptococcus neoformans var. grubii MW-RSA852]
MGNIEIQIIATEASTHFYSQADVDKSVQSALKLSDTQMQDDVGVRIWTDKDEWSDWKKVGDPILHIELRRWTDLVVVAPCSADLLAKIACGLCDTLASSLLRALSPSIPVVICPAMNTHMYQHRLTPKHLAVVQDELGYLVSGPQGSGRLACGDDGPGKMTDWRDIVSLIQGFATMHQTQVSLASSTVPSLSTSYPSSSASPSNTFIDTPSPPPASADTSTYNLPHRFPCGSSSNIPRQREKEKGIGEHPTPLVPLPDPHPLSTEAALNGERMPASVYAKNVDWEKMANDGGLWHRKWWLGV